MVKLLSEATSIWAKQSANKIQDTTKTVYHPGTPTQWPNEMHTKAVLVIPGLT